MKRDKEYYIKRLKELEARDFTVKQVRTAADLWDYDTIKGYGQMDVEYFLCITLDGAHRVINIHEVTKGLLNRTLVHPREVFRSAIKDNAAAIIVAHNHPSNQLEPSSEDRELTSRLREAGDIVGISILDHLILARSSYFSFMEAGI